MYNNTSDFSVNVAPNILLPEAEKGQLDHDIEDSESKQTERSVEIKYQEDEEEDDTHRCAKCQLEFTSLQDYVQHKMTNHKLKVNFLFTNLCC